VVSRRWVWVAGVAAGTLLAARVARAGRAEEDRPGIRSEGQPAVTAPGAARPARTAPVRPARAAPATRSFNGYAADAARSAGRMPPDERAVRAFLRSAAVASRIESEASRLAITRSESDAVRSFASELLQFQQGAEVDLLHLLQARAMALPMLETSQRMALGRLARLDGRKFDRAYMDLVAARRRRDDVVLYQRAAVSVTDPMVKAWIERQLPTLREQQDAAGRLVGGRPPQVASGPRLRLSRTIASSSR